MKLVIEMKIKRIKNALTGKMIEINDGYLRDKRFVKSLSKNADEICTQLEKYYNKKNIISSFNYHFLEDENENGK